MFPPFCSPPRSQIACVGRVIALRLVYGSETESSVTSVSARGRTQKASDRPFCDAEHQVGVPHLTLPGAVPMTWNWLKPRRARRISVAAIPFCPGDSRYRILQGTTSIILHFAIMLLGDILNKAESAKDIYYIAQLVAMYYSTLCGP